MIELNSGDIVYYSPNLALGLLMGKFTDSGGQTIWNYILRSPRRSDLSYYLISKQQVLESKLIANIENGRFEYYKMQDFSGNGQ